MRQIQQNDKQRYSQYYFIYFIGAGAFYPFISLYFKSFGFTETQIGLILSTSPIVSMIAQPIWGMINDYFQKDKVLVGVLSCLTALMLLILSISDGKFGVVMLVYLMFTLFICGVVPVADKMVTNYCLSTEKIKYGQIRIWGSISWGMSSVITGKLIGLTGLPLIIYLFSAFLCLSAVAIMLSPKPKNNTLGSTKSVLKLSDLTQLRKNKLYTSFVGFWFLFQFAALGSHAYFALYLVELGGSSDQIGLATMIGIVAEAPALLYVSRNVEKFGELKLMFIALLLTIIRMVAYILFPSVATLMLMFLLTGLAQGIFIAVCSVYIMKVVAPSVQTTALTLFVAITSGIGNFLGTMIFGSITEASGYSMAYVFMVLPLIAGFILLGYIQKQNHQATGYLNLNEIYI